MKRFLLSTLALAACLLGVQAQNFALVDMEYILEQIPDYTEAARQMDALSEQYQKEVEEVAAQAKSLYEEYQKTADQLTAAQKTAKENAIVAKEKEASELRQKYFGQEGTLAEKQQALFGPVEDSVYNAIKEVALEQGYDVVIDRASAQSMIFASPRIDISNEVLLKLGYSN